MKYSAKLGIVAVSSLLMAPVFASVPVAMQTAEASSLYGNTTPKALRRTWYIGKQKVRGTKHAFQWASYGNYKQKNVTQITKHRIRLGKVRGRQTYGYKERVLFRDIHPYAYGWGETYTQVTYRYKGHNHNGFAMSGHGPIAILTKTKTNGHVKLLHYGW